MATRYLQIGTYVREENIKSPTVTAKYYRKDLDKKLEEKDALFKSLEAKVGWNEEYSRYEIIVTLEVEE